MNRPFWTHLFRPARSKVFGTALVLGASLLAWPASASVPAWLADAAKQPVPAGLPKDTVAVVLYSEQQTTVKPNGETETRYRQACKILRPEGKDDGYVVVFFSKITPIVSFKAWGIPSDGKVYEVKDRDAIETQVNGGEFYDDLKTKILQIPGSDPGNVVGYEYVQKERPYLFLDTWEFQSRIPVMRAVYTLQIPNGWKYDSDWVNYAQSHPQSASENEFSWQVTNVPAIKIEDDMPPWRAVAGRLDVKYFSPADTLQSEQAGSWKDLGLWYSKLTAERRESTPEIQAQVTSLTSNAKTTLDKIEAITSYIQRQIRYVAIEIGIGGWQPHMAGDIFKNQFGDCKDKATLLATMLKDAGIDSYYAVAQIDRGIIQPQFASPGVFNHVILAIRLPGDVPTNNLYATVDDPKLGKLLFFDPTDQYTPIGYLPDTEQDNYVLVVTPDGGQLVKLPLLSPPTNRLMRVGEFTLTPQGDLAGRVREIRWGGPAVDTRAEYLQVAPKDREKIMDQFLGAFLDNLQLQSASIGNLTQFDQSLTMDYSLADRSYAKQVGDLILLRPRVIGQKTSVDIAPAGRRYPVEFPEATLQTDQYDFTLPPGYRVDELPPPAKVDCGFISYQSHITVNGNVLRYVRSFEINHVIVPVSGLTQLRSALDAIAADERSSVVLKRSTE